MASRPASLSLDRRVSLAARVDVPDALIERINDLYNTGRCVDAANAALEAGHPQTWRGGKALCLAGRLLPQVGASRLGMLLTLRAYRETPADPEVALHYLYRAPRLGNMQTWEQAQRLELRPQTDDKVRANLLAMRGGLAAVYRDFSTAWSLQNEGERLLPDNAWMQVEAAEILLKEERREEGLARLERALELRPWYRPAVQYRARVLHLLKRYDEAVAYLTEATRHLQNAPVVDQLISLKRELDDPAGMEELLHLADRYCPLADGATREMHAARRTDILCLKEDFSAAAAEADKVTGEYYSRLAKRLREVPPDRKPKRLRLPFTYVLQNHNTCGPATIAALVQYWQRPISMEQIVDSICYDGTYDHTERSWALTNDFAVREFRITEEATRLLIDNQAPFAMATTEVGSGHLQAMVGYDEVRASFFIQDPSEPHYREVAAENFLKEYSLNGPRGMVIVPKEKAEWLASLPLPEADAYDVNYAFHKALSTWQRGDAVAELTRLRREHPGHRLTLLAELSLASFDADETRQESCIQALLELYPDDPRLITWQLNNLRALGKDTVPLLKSMQHAERSHPAFVMQLARWQSDDARQWKEAISTLWRSHRMMPVDGSTLNLLADVLRLSGQRAPDDVLVYHRFAAAYADKVEHYARRWFSMANSRGKQAEALEWLQRRVRDYGAKSAGPALTYAQSLDSLGKPEFVQVLRDAVALRPEDGELLLALARACTREGKVEEAAEILARAEGRCSAGLLLRAQASQNRWKGDREKELYCWRQLLDYEPLAMDAHAAVADDFQTRQGPAAALEYYQRLHHRFPQHYGVFQSLVQRLHEESPERALTQAQEMAQAFPSDVWCRREMALILANLGRHEDAIHVAKEAVDLCHTDPMSHCILGGCYARAQRNQEAVESYRFTLKRDVNQSQAIHNLVNLGQTTEGQLNALGFIREEMIKQRLTGEGLHAYRDCAFTVLDPGELRQQLQEIWKARPDLWESWSVYSAQILESGGDSSEALLLAREATERFALIPGAWLDLSKTAALLGESERPSLPQRRLSN
jgi:cellulose synthase operon protein C